MKRDFRWMGFFFLCSLYAFGCPNTVSGGGAGGQVGSGGGGSGGSGGSGGCASGCGPTGVCPQGQFCMSFDPCGDSAQCMPIPSACAAAPTCACILEQSGEGGQGGQAQFTCGGDPTTGFTVADQDGDSPCCP